jgi:hypothetical protein
MRYLGGERRGWDSNPRLELTPSAGFQDRSGLAQQSHPGEVCAPFRALHAVASGGTGRRGFSVAAFSAAAEPRLHPTRVGLSIIAFRRVRECYEAAQNELKQCPAFCERLFDRSDPDERTTMDELESYHVDTLKLVLDKASTGNVTYAVSQVMRLGLIHSVCGVTSGFCDWPWY